MQFAGISGINFTKNGFNMSKSRKKGDNRADLLLQQLWYIKNSSGMSMVIPTLDSELPGFIALENDLR